MEDRVCDICFDEDDKGKKIGDSFVCRECQKEAEFCACGNILNDFEETDSGVCFTCGI